MGANIHHIDGNPLNNPDDGSNWELLCETCHQKIPKHRRNNGGIYISVSFAPWKRAEIFNIKGSYCNQCGAKLTTERTSAKPRPRCYRCGIVIDRKCDLIIWKNGKTMCQSCFDDFTKGLTKQESKPEVA